MCGLPHSNHAALAVASRKNRRLQAALKLLVAEVLLTLRAHISVMHGKNHLFIMIDVFAHFAPLYSDYKSLPAHSCNAFASMDLSEAWEFRVNFKTRTLARNFFLLAIATSLSIGR